MARAYFRTADTDWLPFYSNERGVGLNMANGFTDVLLIQCFLKAVLEGNRQLWGIQWTRPSGPGLAITGVWDAASKSYLKHWEDLQVRWKMKERGNTTGGTTIPGTVVPYSQGGKKIVWMNAQILAMYGKTDYIICVWGSVALPLDLTKQLVTTQPQRPHLDVIL